MKQILTLSLAVIGMALVSTSAFAGISVTPVPEPASLALLMGGVATLGIIRRRRK